VIIERLVKPTTVRRLIRTIALTADGRRIGWVQSLRSVLAGLTVEEKDEMIIRLVRQLRDGEIDLIHDDFHAQSKRITEEVAGSIEEFFKSEELVKGSNCGVYFMRTGDRIKIGSSHDVFKRLYELSTGAFERPTLVGWIPHETWHGARALEISIHEHFSSKRAHREWFDLSTTEAEEFIRARGGHVSAHSQ
jgi:hypothetical protein